MLRIKLTTPFPEWPLERQTPNSKGVWGNCKFFINQDVTECDFWIVYDNLLVPEITYCPPNNTILITGEPPSIRYYNSDYVNQFASVITCHRDLPHPNIFWMQQALPWHIGRIIQDQKTVGFSKDYDQLSRSQSFEKDKLISVIISDKEITEGHRRRLEFVTEISNNLGSLLSVFGIGIQEVEDKWDAIAPYKFHIVLENSAIPDYWTEKLADAYLGAALPIYYGCTNLSDYFLPSSYVSIDLDTSNAISIIERVIGSQLYEQSVEDIMIAREKVLNKYNLFPMICEFCSNLSINEKSKPITLFPMSSERSPFIKRLWRRLLHKRDGIVIPN